MSLIDSSQSGPSHARARRRQWRWAWFAAVVVALVIFGSSIWRGDAFPSAEHPAPAPEASSSAAPPTLTASDSLGSSPSSPATPVRAVHGELDEDAAQALISQYLHAAAAMTQHPDSVTPDLDVVAGKSIIEEVEAQLRELDSQGWNQTGTPTVVTSKVLDLDEATGTAEVEMCIDSSEVELLDYDGKPLPPSTAPRALNLYSLKQHDGDAWIIVSHSFPNDPSC